MSIEEPFAEEDDPLETAKRLRGTLPNPVLPPTLGSAIFNELSFGMIVVEFETRTIAFVNSTAELLFGYDRTELVARPVEILVPEDRRAAHEQYTSRYRLDPRPRPMGHGSLVLQGRHKSGRIFDANIMLTPLATPDGHYILVTVIALGARHDAAEAPGHT